MMSLLYTILVRGWSYVLYIGGIFLIDEEIQLSLGLPPYVITNSIGFVVF